MNKSTARRKLSSLLRRIMREEQRELARGKPKLSNPKLARKIERALLRAKRG